MLVTIEEIKEYLKITYEDEDTLLLSLIKNAQNICLSVIRVDDLEAIGDDIENIKIAIKYTVAYLYEHREVANYNELILNIRSLLFNVRQESF